MTRRTVFGALILLGTALGVPGRAEAQDHRLSLTGYLGGAGYSNLAGTLDPGLMLKSGGFYGGMAELWFGRLGLRLHAGAGSPSLESDPAMGFNIVAGDMDLVARFRRPRADLIFQPYGVLGLGALRYDLSPDASAVGGFAYDGDPAKRGTLVLGIGTDLGRGPVALRLEMMDIIGFSSPLSRTDGSHFEPVSHVIFTLGLSLRMGTIELAPPPAKAPVTRVQPTEPRAPAPPRDTVAQPEPDTTGTTRDSLRYRPRLPDVPYPQPVDTAGQDTTTAPDTTSMTPTAPDTVGKGPRRPPIDSGPRVPPHPDTVAPPVEPTDTAASPAPPPDTASSPPGDPDPGDTVRGRLFSVRVAWDPEDPAESRAARALMATLIAAGVPLWPPEPDPEQPVEYQRAAALTNAADARILGNYIQAQYRLMWEWVHIDKEEEVHVEEVYASTAFVDGLREEGHGPGRPGGTPR